MSLVVEYQSARTSEHLARVRRTIALRTLVAIGMTQREIASKTGVSQPAISQQLKSGADLRSEDPDALLRAAAPVLKALAADRGYKDLAVFGSIARGTSHSDSDIDLLVKAPETASSFDFVEFKTMIESILDRQIDLVDYGSLKSPLDDDILHSAVHL